MGLWGYGEDLINKTQELECSMPSISISWTFAQLTMIGWLTVYYYLLFGGGEQRFKC